MGVFGCLNDVAFPSASTFCLCLVFLYLDSRDECVCLFDYMPSLCGSVDDQLSLAGFQLLSLDEYTSKGGRGCGGAARAAIVRSGRHAG